MANSTAEVLEPALARIVEDYIFPEPAQEVAQLVRGKLASGGYDGLAGAALCEAATVDFQSVTRDKHLRLLWNDEPQAVEEDGDEEDDAGFTAMSVAENHGVHRVERLDGNIGYIDTRIVADPRDGARTIDAAMLLVSGTSALIIDVRRNKGGSPAGVAYWCSYLFPDGDVHLNDIYRRRDDRLRQFWTLDWLPGQRYLGRPVYVLTSATTFSGAEELAYNLKANKRAVLIGETTRGGAHPTTWHRLTPHITVTVPDARSINPVTGTNWEGTGVEPDIAASAEEAFDLAYQDALAKTAEAA
jgi:C-terminal processing protease CtpA/Prc